AEDGEVGWIASELTVEIEYVAVRIALAQDGHEAENPRLQTESFAIGGDQPLAGELGGSVQGGLHRKRRVFGSWKDGGLTIDRSRGREDDLADAVDSHCLEHVVGGDGVVFEILARLIGTTAHISVGGEMEYVVRAVQGHRRLQRGGIQQVTLH